MSHERSQFGITSAADISLKELQALVSIVDVGSFRGAADELGFTQSALSHQVAMLERKLGHQLFTRPGGRAAVVLTTAGEVACRRARRVLGEADAIPTDIEAAEHGTRLRIRVGVSQTTAAEIMPAALRDFRELHPDVEVILEEIDTDERIIGALDRGRLDLGFVHDLEPDERVHAIPVTEDPWVLLTRRDSALATLERPDLAVLHGAEVVAWTRRWRGQLALEDVWGRRGIVPKIVYRTDDNLAMQRLVAAGLGDACVGYLSARRAIDTSLTWLAPADPVLPRPVVLCYARSSEPTPTVSALVGSIRSQAPRPFR